jgi:hypothetical protein
LIFLHTAAIFTYFFHTPAYARFSPLLFRFGFRSPPLFASPLRLISFQPDFLLMPLIFMPPLLSFTRYFHFSYAAAFAFSSPFHFAAFIFAPPALSAISRIRIDGFLPRYIIAADFLPSSLLLFVAITR